MSDEKSREAARGEGAPQAGSHARQPRMGPEAERAGRAGGVPNVAAALGCPWGPRE